MNTRRSTSPAPRIHASRDTWPGVLPRAGRIFATVVRLRFLGTGGARWVVAKQIRSSGGFWLQADGTNIHVDPGPGALVRALTQLDHAGDINAMIEAMCQGGWRPRGALCAPRDALDEGQQPVVYPYARCAPVSYTHLRAHETG